MKKIFIILTTLLFTLAVASCKDKKPVPIDDPTLDDNGTSDVDQDLRIDSSKDPNYVEGLNYEYTGDWGHNKDYKKPGMFNTDGTIHVLPLENPSSGMRISVTMFGAKANDSNFDNTKAVKDAIASARDGDTVYFPTGKYYFSTNSLSAPYFSHIYLYSSNVNIEGAGKDTTFLVSKFDGQTNLEKATATLTIMNASNVTVSNLTFTSEVPSEKMPTNLDTTLNNPEGNQYAPRFHIIAVGTDPTESTSNIVIRDSRIQFFQETGILLNKTQDCVIKNCEISDATDIGGGGAGYGILIRGNGFESFSMVGTNLDSRYNLITGNIIKGPYMRHSIILSYVTHNNLIHNNEIIGCQDEPLDLHGEDEFLNVIANNKVKDVSKAAIGLGNPGSTHDATGPGNIVYGNEVDGADGGIQISYGTPDTQIYNNVFKNLYENSIGINLTFAPNTTVRNNVVENIPGSSIGLAVYYSYVWNNPTEGVVKLDIQSNEFKSIKIGMQFDVYMVGTKIKNNTITNADELIINNKSTFELPPVSNYFEPVEGTSFYPTQEGNINRGNYTSVINPVGYYYFKGSHEEPLLNRVIYEEYNIDQNVVNNSSRVYLRITTTSKGAKQHFFFWVAENLNWDATEITWGNAPYINNTTNNSSLSIDPTGEYSITEYPYASQIYDPNSECKLMAELECVVVDEAFLTYYIDITDFIKNSLTSTNFTIIITNETMDAAYSSVRNMIGNPQNIWPCLIFVE